MTTKAQGSRIAAEEDMLAHEPAARAKAERLGRACLARGIRTPEKVVAVVEALRAMLAEHDCGCCALCRRARGALPPAGRDGQ